MALPEHYDAALLGVALAKIAGAASNTLPGTPAAPIIFGIIIRAGDNFRFDPSPNPVNESPNGLIARKA
jgi:hypothetical protein